MSTQRWLNVGIVTGVYGVRGAVKVAPLDHEVFVVGRDVVAVTEDGTQRRLRVVAVRKAARHIIVQFGGVDDRAAAEGLRGAELVMERSDLPSLPPGVFRAGDLVGLHVRDVRLGDIGVVERVLHYPGSDMLSVGARGVLIPLLRAYGVRVDLDARRIDVELPPGFEELLAP